MFIPYDVPTDPIPYRETWAPYAFRWDDVYLLIGHDGERFGRLAVRHSDKGVTATITLDEADARSRSLLERIKQGEFVGVSPAFIVSAEYWSADKTERTVVNARLVEVSLINTVPANWKCTYSLGD